MSPPAAVEHLPRALEFARSATTLLLGGHDVSATAEAYYAVLHVARALLASSGVAAETHAGVHAMVARLFVKGGALPPDFSRRFAQLQRDRELAHDGVFDEIERIGAGDAIRGAVRLLRDALPVLRDRDPATGELAGELLAAADRLEATIG